MYQRVAAGGDFDLRILDWEVDRKAGAAFRTFVGSPRRFVFFADTVRDGEAQSHPAGLVIARRIEADKWFENGEAIARWNAGTIVVDMQGRGGS